MQINRRTLLGFLGAGAVVTTLPLPVTAKELSTSSLEKIRIRKLLLAIEEAISRNLEYVLYEPNDRYTRKQIEHRITDEIFWLENHKQITGTYKVVCDETNNTPEIIDNHGIVVDVYIKPNKSVNYIKIKGEFQKESVKFNELTSS